MDCRVLEVAQLEVTGYEVGVEVGEEDVRDPAAELVGVVDVLPDVALGIDHHRLAAPLIRDQVARMGEAPEVVLLEDHSGWETKRIQRLWSVPAADWPL